jgi:hypothetical protein
VVTYWGLADASVAVEPARKMVRFMVSCEMIRTSTVQIWERFLSFTCIDGLYVGCRVLLLYTLVEAVRFHRTQHRSDLLSSSVQHTRKDPACFSQLLPVGSWIGTGVREKRIKTDGQPHRLGELTTIWLRAKGHSPDALILRTGGAD